MSLIVVVMKRYVVVFKALSWCKADQELKLAEGVHSRGDFTTVVWLNGI